MTRLFTAITHIFAIIIVLSLSASNASAKEIYVDMPDSCYKVQEVKDNKVYLVASIDKCIGVQIKAITRVDDAITKVDIFVNGEYWKSQELIGFSTDAVSKAVETAKTYGNKYTVPHNIHQKEADIAAKKLDEFYRSPEFQKKIAAETKRIEEALLNPAAVGNKKNEDDNDKGYYHDKKQVIKKGKIPSNERLYLFISSSMPDVTLRNYIASLNKLNDPNITAVMRGFIGGAKYTIPTMKFIKDMLVKMPGCEPLKEKCEMLNANVSIDPMLFARYSITKVPALVYVPHTNVTDQYMSEGDPNNAKHQEYHVVYGDASLDYLLEVIYEHTGQKSLESIIATLRKGYY
ncbi:MAG: hypothetical protein ILNGONEN_02053 [Syntrophorhabdaceae bacterium]|jgi:type-F conjugative transfer system pilin assembly protein TrbC|nr:hypothetical protein [Syntrophorhabdaceae bacterium]MDI9560222.1 type-F conjugative transfer system pilin assembly protein TrbC [Pseudomonadota bacterium]